VNKQTTLPESWIECPIEDIFAPLEDGRTLHQGWSPQCEAYPSPSEEIWGALRTTAIQPGSFHDEHNKCLPEKLTPRPLLEVKPGDILITCAGPRARCGVACLVRSVRRRLMISGKMYRFRMRDGHVDPRFVEYFLQTTDAQAAIDRMKTGGSDSGLNLTHDRFRQLMVRLAPREEQRRIVLQIEKQFTRLDAAVGALKRTQANLKRYRAAVLKAACEGRLVPTEAELARGAGRIYEPASVLLERILTKRAPGKKRAAPLSTEEISALPHLPEGWTWATTEQVGKIQLGRQRSPQHHNGPHLRPYLRVANVFEDRIDTSDVLSMNFSPSDFATYELKHGDILLNEGQSLELVGRAAMYRSEVPGACFQNTLIRFSPYEGLDRNYALMVFLAYLHNKRFQKAARWTVNIAHLGAERLSKIEFPLSPLDEQVRIVSEVERRLSVLKTLESQLSANLARAEQLRQSVLLKAFAGQLVSQDPNDEPADVLLDQIRSKRQESAKPQRQREKQDRTLHEQRTLLPLH